MPELLVKQLHYLPGELGEEIAVHLAAQPREAGGRDKARLALTSAGGDGRSNTGRRCPGWLSGQFTSAPRSLTWIELCYCSCL